MSDSNIVLQPQPGPQTAYSACDATVAFYGGEPKCASFHGNVSKTTPLIAGKSHEDNQQPSPSLRGEGSEVSRKT